MEFARLLFSAHAVRRMFERGITTDDVRRIAADGEVIADYPDDTPYPSYLLLGWVGERPLHIVAAVDNANQECYVVTVYVPDIIRWTEDYRKRRAK